jgi:alkylhydroperoxidase family enzyme
MTDISRGDAMWAHLSASTLRSFAPEAFASFDAAIGAVSSAADPVLLELVRRRIGMLLGATLDDLPSLAVLSDAQLTALADWPTSTAFSAADRVSLGFAEQFIVDVAGTTDDDRAALGGALGSGTFGFVQALYVLDHGVRLVVVLRQLFGCEPIRPTPPARGSTLWTALETMMTAVVCLHALDPLTSELIRLRGAGAHNCRLCKSRRSIDAVVADADAIEQVGDFENSTIGEAQRAALRLTDAILWRPTTLPADVIANVREHFPPEPALEIVLDVVRNASNKIAVALGADQPRVATGVEFFDVTDVGEYRYGLPAPTAP